LVSKCKRRVNSDNAEIGCRALMSLCYFFIVSFPDLDSTHICYEVPNLHPHSDAILICLELPTSVSLLTVLLQFVHRQLGPFLNPEPPSATPVEVCAGDPFVSHVQASKPVESSFTEYVIHTVLSSSNSDLFVCYSVIPGNAQDALLKRVISAI